MEMPLLSAILCYRALWLVACVLPRQVIGCTCPFSFWVERLPNNICFLFLLVSGRRRFSCLLRI